ncbi:MAG: hypothetical protein QME79_07740 [Bacillota bacterium]|nr:hypothetical protein [Bacillota bacterium]
MAKRQRRIDPEVYREIHRMVREGGYTNAAEIWREVDHRFPDKAPSERTIRSVVRELLPPDASGPWRPGPENDPEDDARILATMAECAARSKGRSWQWELTQEHARWIAWLRAGWPDLDPVAAVVLAADYRARRETGRDCRDLDGYLAFAPWRSPEAYGRYQDAVKQGWLPESPDWYWTAAMAQNVQKQLGKERGANG